MGFAHGGEMSRVPFPASYPYSAEAVTKVRLRRLGRGRFNAVVDGSDSLRPLLLARMQQELGVAHKHMIVLAHGSVRRSGWSHSFSPPPAGRARR